MPPSNGPDPIRLSVLGGLDLRAADGRELRSVLAQPKRSALLGYLALSTTSGFHRRDTLLAMFWPEAEPSRARHALSQALYGLRQALGEGVITNVGDDQLVLEGSRLWCDARAFASALEEGRDRDALELYRGALLDGFHLSEAPAFQEWLELERTRLRDSATAAAWRLAEADALSGNAAGAAAWGRRAAAIAPDDEVSLRRLLDLLQRLGDRSGALAAYEQFARRLAGEGMAPSPDTTAVVERMKDAPTHPVAPPADEPRTPPLPTPATPFVGREEEREELLRLLARDDARLVTVTGPGGIGKTRLALDIAERTSRTSGRTTVFVPLAGLSSAAQLPQEIAHALGVEGDDVDVAARIRHRLGSRDHLLVLDNFEPLVEAAPYVAELAGGSARAKILVTSREPLRLRGEWVLPLAGLPVPDERDPEPASSPAVRLFVATAGRMRGELEMTAATQQAVVRICRLAEGVPLALELAAAWTRVLSCPEIVREIEKSRRFLAGSLRDVPERHRSVWAAFEQSWLLLDPDERRAFAAVSVLQGSFDRAAAEAVAGADLRLLAALLDKSLIRRVGPDRYDTLEALREFAHEKLQEHPEVARQTAVRHMRHYAGLLAASGRELRGAGREAALEAVTREQNQVRAAWSTAVRTGDLATLELAADALFTWYEVRGLYHEAEAAFDQAVAAVRASPSPAAAVGGVLAILLGRYGAACLRSGRYDAAGDALEEALERSERAGLPREVAHALDRLTLIRYERGEHHQAKRLQLRCLELRREIGEPEGIATSLNNLGSLSYGVGDYATARRYCRECLDLQRSLGDRHGMVITLQNLGYIELVLGDPAAAERYLEGALEAADAVGSPTLRARARLNLGNLSNARGDPAAALDHFASALSEGGSVAGEPFALEVLLGICASLRGMEKPGQALQLAALVAEHERTESGSRAVASRLASELAEGMPAAALTAALQEARGATLEDVVRRYSERAAAGP